MGDILLIHGPLFVSPEYFLHGVYKNSPASTAEADIIHQARIADRIGGLG